MKNAGIKKLTLKSLLNGNLTVTKALLVYLKKTSLIRQKKNVSFYSNVSHSTPVGGRNAPKLVCQPPLKSEEEVMAGS